MDEYYVPITWAEIELLRDPAIGKLGVLVYMAVKFRAMGNRTTSYPSLARICNDLKDRHGTEPTRSGVTKALNKLEKIGLIRRKRGGSSKGTTLYTITHKKRGVPVDAEQSSSIPADAEQIPADAEQVVSQRNHERDNLLNNIYYNNKGNILDTIFINGKEYNLNELFNSIKNTPDTFYMILRDEDIDYLKKFIREIRNPDLLVSQVVEILISYRNY